MSSSRRESHRRREDVALDHLMHDAAIRSRPAASPADADLDLSPPALDAFLARTVEDAAMAHDVAERAGITVDHAAERLADLASEARLAVRLLARAHPTRGTRLLEICAGAGVVAAFLHHQGATLHAIEPLVDGFDRFAVVRVVLATRVEVPAIAAATAADLRPATDSVFDLIFSVNVVEHMHPLAANLDALAAVLAPGGRMIHTCPNYQVPYEPATWMTPMIFTLRRPLAAAA